MIVIDDMRGAGKIGYVARRLSNGDKQFIHPTERTGYSTSRQKLTFNITIDGIYEICDANFGSSKKHKYYLKIENGITKHFESFVDLIADNNDLPALEGSEKQIAWAENIRAKFAASLALTGEKMPDGIFFETSAKWWIDNRSKA